MAVVAVGDTVYVIGGATARRATSISSKVGESLTLKPGKS